MWQVPPSILSYLGSESDVWNPNSADPVGPWRVVCHNDLAPWNLVAGATGWGLMDWDLASPGRPEWDLAWAIHTLVPTFPDVGVPDDLVIERMLTRSGTGTNNRGSSASNSA